VAKPTVGPPPAEGTRPAGARVEAARASGRVGSEEFHSSVLPCAQEAAVLYAANHSDAAVALLRTEIKDPVGRNNKQAWLMLFDIYQTAQNRAEYDAFSMLFSVKFEQSPPAWAEGDADALDPRRTQSRERKDFFTLKAPAGGHLAAEIEKFHAFAESMGTVRLDFSKLTFINSDEAKLLATVLQRLRKKGLPMWFNNLEHVEKFLRVAFNEKASDVTRPYWTLLFELYVLQGKMEAFEDLGLEYAVAFEMSPPAWEVYVNTVSAAVAKATNSAKAAANAPPPETGFALKGVISSSSQNQFAELTGHAAGLSEVAVDMSKVLRVDFAAAGLFFEVVKAIQIAGKRVILSQLNELNAALLEAFGFSRHAILIRRKSI
jgi:anti-anti-sigma regulatory factor